MKSRNEISQGKLQNGTVKAREVLLSIFIYLSPCDPIKANVLGALFIYIIFVLAYLCLGLSIR